MLLNIILTIVLLYLFTILINRESFTPSNYMYINEFKSPICTVGGNDKCIENGFKNNNNIFIRKYMNNNNYKAKQTNDSVLIPKYIF